MRLVPETPVRADGQRPARCIKGLITEVLDFQHQSDETEMLRSVFEAYLNEPDVIDAIRECEKALDESWYTKKRTLFGMSSEIPLKDAHVFGNLAKRIKAVRNAIVHSSDKYERSERHLPFSESESTIEKELFLMQYLAEKIIIASAETALAHD